MSKNTLHEHHLQYHCHKGVTGEFIAQIVEVPEIIVHAPTKEAVKIMIKDAFNAYLNAFPEEHDKIFKEIESEQPTVEEVVVKC